MPHKKDARLIWVNSAWWVCAVCQCPTKRRLGLYGLIVPGGSALFVNAPTKRMLGLYGLIVPGGSALFANAPQKGC